MPDTDVPNLYTTLKPRDGGLCVCLPGGWVAHVSIEKVRGSEVRLLVRAPREISVYPTAVTSPTSLRAADSPQRP